MKCTWPTRKFCVGDPTKSIFHWLVLGFCVGGNANFMFYFGGNANFSVFRYQHVVGIGNAKSSGLASQWNIGFSLVKVILQVCFVLYPLLYTPPQPHSLTIIVSSLQHHCRLCGRIFCYACCNQWVKTPHSRYLLHYRRIPSISRGL